MPRVLMVDDDLAMRNTVARLLTAFGYETCTVADGETALAVADGNLYDLVILDVRLPKMDGMEVCRKLRERSLVPILMLTALHDELDKVLGFEAGADDYLTKPFSGLELLARVSALLRRAALTQGGGTMETKPGDKNPQLRLRVGCLEIDMLEHRVKKNGRPIQLNPREFQLIAYLARYPGATFSSRKLLEEVWGYHDSADTRTVAVHIHWLRKKLEDDPKTPRTIETVKGEGYRLSVRP